MALEPSRAAVLSFQQGAAQDPWGQAWIHEGAMDGRIWSAGPNGLDESRAGDDVVVNNGLFTLGYRSLLFLNAPTLLWLLGAALMGLRYGYFNHLLPYLRSIEGSKISSFS